MRKEGIDKIAQILTTTKKPTLKNHILCKCNIPNPQFNKYLHLLLQAGLLDAYPSVNTKHIVGRKTRRRMIYQTSNGGITFLKKYRQLTMMLQTE